MFVFFMPQPPKHFTHMAKTSPVHCVLLVHAKYLQQQKVSVAVAVAVVVCRDVTHMWAILCSQWQLLFFLMLLPFVVVVVVFSQTCAYGRC